MPCRYMRWREIVVFVVYLAGAVVFTYPLARDIRTATTDHSDPLLDAWALAWVAHQLPRDPIHLFDSNRFYPEKGTLAYTDPMIGLAVPLAPLQWLFGDALLTLNVAMLLSIAISGYGAYRLGWYVSGSRAAGAVAGSVFAFAAYRLNHLEHVQLQAAGYIPLLYLCLRRFLEEGHTRHAIGIAVFLWLVSASSAYYGMFTWVLLGVAIPYELWRTSALRQKKRVVGLGLALTMSGLAFLPLALPFMRMGESFRLERPLERLQRASARPTDYLRSGSHLHQAVGLKPPSPERTLFPGLLALGLSAVAIFKLNRSTACVSLDRRRRSVGESRSRMGALSLAARARSRSQRRARASENIDLRFVRGRDSRGARSCGLVPPISREDPRSHFDRLPVGRVFRRSDPVR